MKKAYISGITSDSLRGVLVMFQSLRDCTQDQSIEFSCFVTEDVSAESIKKLKDFDVHVFVTEKIKGTENDRWSTTFQKLTIFNMTEYDKIVWIDADMMVINSLDSLFRWPHMSCVRSRSPLSGGGILSIPV